MYVVDINSDEPIMLINKHIGMDSEDGMGIDGAIFQRELLQLDSMGKKRIQVWINSPGGIVMDGYSIFNAILKSKTPVDTYNVGIAASIAGVIFMAGRNRVMADYSSLMIHPPSGSTDKQQIDALRDSLIKMLASKSNVSEVEMMYLMNRTTWLNAAECFAKGFCTSIEVTAEANKKKFVHTTNVMEMWRVANSINENHNKNTHKNRTMTKITMKLGLNDAATEDNVIAAIKEVENNAYNADVARIKAENDLQAITNASKAEKDAAKKKMDELENKMAEDKKAFDALKQQFDAMCKDKEAAETATKNLAAKNMVEGYAKTGRIKNEASVILKWTNLAIADLQGTEDLIKELPLNKEAEILHIENTLSLNDLPTTAPALAIKNRLAREAKNKSKA